MLSRYFRLTVMAIAVFSIPWTAAIAQQQSIPDFFVDETKLPFDALPGTTTERYWGVHKNAGYRVEVPANWNGDLVLYAHGFRGEGPELTVSNPSIRAYLVDNGFAWAASSYSKNRYDVKAGIQDTHALTKLFNGLVGKPDRTYIMGHSMGGHITGATIEQYPKAYDGALPMCGVMGDVELFDFFLSYNLVAQAAAGIDATYPDPDFQTEVRPDLVAALGPAYPSLLNTDGETVKAATKYLTGGDRPLYDIAFLIWADFLLQFGDDDGTLSGVLPGNVSTNVGTVYQLDGDPALSGEEMMLNQNVLRVAADPQARRSRGIANVPKISGDLPVPVISIHTLGDLFVPFHMQQIYAREVAEQGKSDLLVQRAIRDVGHCAFTTEEQEQAFADLVGWVEAGIRPAGDDVLDPATVADPDYGCQFTTVDRPFAPACP
ncbi:prolyl oligopeptidase family serine peptidase [Ectothiorhodospiraceae bacterium WFHF3C12]|nr:prolyl oligopeptidase family serine peptidase [Ectothiorhodospiraceae bacterium WFHF3C12]